MITSIEYTLLGQFDIPPGVAQHNRHTRSLAAPPLPRHFTNSPTAGLSSYPVLLPSSIGTSPAVAAAAAAVATAVSTVSKGGSGGTPRNCSRRLLWHTNWLAIGTRVDRKYICSKKRCCYAQCGEYMDTGLTPKRAPGCTP